MAKLLSNGLLSKRKNSVKLHIVLKCEIHSQQNGRNGKKWHKLTKNGQKLQSYKFRFIMKKFMKLYSVQNRDIHSHQNGIDVQKWQKMANNGLIEFYHKSKSNCAHQNGTK